MIRLAIVLGVIVAAAGCVPAEVQPTEAREPAPRCPTTTINLSGTPGGDGDGGDAGANGAWAGDRGDKGGSGNDGYPGAAGPTVAIAIGFVDAQHVRVRIASRRPRDLIIDPTCPPLQIRARGGDGGGGGSGGRGGDGGTATLEDPYELHGRSGPSGGSGERGPGGDGGRGGDGGHVTIRFDRLHPELPALLSVDTRGGNGAAGGRSGAQGEPGANGPAAVLEPVDAATLFPTVAHPISPR